MKERDVRIEIKEVIIKDPEVAQYVEILLSEITKRNEEIAIANDEITRLKVQLEEKNDELKRAYHLVKAADQVVNAITKNLTGTASYIAKLRIDLDTKLKTKMVK